MKLQLDRGDAPWPTKREVHLIRTDSEGYNKMLHDTIDALRSIAPRGVIVAANRPVRILKKALDDEGISYEGAYFIDCVTAMTGIMPPKDDDTMYIESPSMLEKIGLRAEQVLRHQGGDRFLLVDSLSTLAVYNGADAVVELAHTLLTRMRIHGVATGMLLVDNQADATLVDTMRALCDGVVERAP